LASTGKRIGARAIDALVCLILFVIPLVLVPSDRVLARLTVGFALVVAYETVFVLALGATPGKQITGLRVGRLDRPSVDPQAALRRGMISGFMTLAVAWLPLVLPGNTGTDDGYRLALGVSVSLAAAFVGLCAALSALTSPQRRGFVDRIAGTVVLDRSAPVGFGTRELSERAAQQAPVATNPAGPPASFDRRRRARASRLDDAPVLVLLIVALGFVLSVPGLSGWIFGLLGLLWVVTFVADEAWRISRAGATGGHRRFGLAVVDRTTGEAPSPLQSTTRAILVALPLYVLPTTIIVAFARADDHVALLVLGALAGVLEVVWILTLRFMAGRSLHDLAAHTTVVAVAEPEVR
jgi:uncharacterized RDD family membrane protein YckC